MECRPVIGLCDDFPNVVAGIHGIDAGHFAGGAGVYRLDTAMGDRAAEDFRMQHAGQLHQMSIFRATGHFVVPFSRGSDRPTCPPDAIAAAISATLRLSAWLHRPRAQRRPAAAHACRKPSRASRR